MKLDVLLMMRWAAWLPACLAVTANAVEWSSSASVTPSVTYTDNVCLAADDEKGEWVGLVTPSVSLNANGNRANLNLSASAQVNSLSNGTLRDRGCDRGGRGLGDRRQFAPSLNASANSVLVENWFYLDGSATANQNQVSPFVSGGGDALDRTGNTNTTYQYNVTPRISRRFKDAAILNLSYTWNDQYNSTTAVGDSVQQSAQASLGSVPGQSAFTWGLNGNYAKTDYSDDPGRATNNATELKSAQVNLGYQLDRSWQLNGYYGDESNDYASTRDDIDGSYWDVGLRWTPTVRTMVEVGTGKAYSGNRPRLAVSYRHKRSAFSANYSRGLGYNRDIRGGGNAVPFNPDIAPPPELALGQTTLTNSPILNEQFTLGYSFQGLRTGMGLSAFQSDQTQEDNGSKSSYRGVSFSINRSLARELSVSAGVNWNEQDPKDADEGFFNNSETFSGTLGMQRRLGQNMSVSFNYQYTDRQSDNAFDEYTENRFTLNLSITL